LIKYTKSVLWRVAKRLPYIEDARCLKVNHTFLEYVEEIRHFISIWFLSLSSKDPGDINIVAGDVMLDRSSCTSVRRSVSAVFMHEEYDIHTFKNDIALIRVCH